MRTAVNTIKGWAKVVPFCLIVLSALFASCSEDDGTVEEYPNWQNANEQYFETQYLSHSSQGIIPKWSLAEGTTPAHTDCILVDVLNEGAGTTSPYYNDTVTVHYAGRLIPSTSYAQGYQFDSSYSGTFDEAVAVPTLFLANGLVPGFTTALLHMHRGDRWRVTIPYQLGYGTATSGSIPAYSTLIFDIQLVDFWSKTRGDRD